MCILQELTDQMRAFVEQYEKNADGKIDIIEVKYNSLNCNIRVELHSVYSWCMLKILHFL